jgi:hypothetical protein
MVNITVVLFTDTNHAVICRVASLAKAMPGKKVKQFLRLSDVTFLIE